MKEQYYHCSNCSWSSLELYRHVCGRRCYGSRRCSCKSASASHILYCSIRTTLFTLLTHRTIESKSGRKERRLVWQWLVWRMEQRVVLRRRWIFLWAWHWMRVAIYTLRIETIIEWYSGQREHHLESQSQAWPVRETSNHEIWGSLGWITDIWEKCFFEKVTFVWRIASQQAMQIQFIAEWTDRLRVERRNILPLGTQGCP